MALTDKQKDALNKLYSYRENIENILVEIDAILQVNFPSEYPTAYQHWIPQIQTSLKNDPKWLPRGQYNMEYTLNRIIDKIENDTKGVTKYI